MGDPAGAHTADLLRLRMPDGHKHHSVLRAPEFGILDFRLKAGAKESKFYLPVGARKSPKLETGDDAFNFAPVAEKIELRYEIDNPFGIVDGGSLEIFTRFNKDPLAKIDLAKLGATWLMHGTHVVTWDGRIPKEAHQQGTMKGDDITHDLTKLEAKADPDGPFPDGYLTLEHPPYKLRLTLTSKAAAQHPATAYTFCHILIKEIKLELGTEAMVPRTDSDAQLARDKAVRKRLEAEHGLPAVGSTRKIFLRSNIYKRTSAEMDDNTAYTEYESAWGKGPNIPIVARIRLASSANAEVTLEEDNNAWALGNARFLWDWVDVDEDVSALRTKPKQFISAAINYYNDGTDATRPAKDHTYPKGDNCHVDRGGKRGPDASPIFEEHDGYDPADNLTAGEFPFAVEQCKTRTWASYSSGWTTGKLKGRTGVVFRPSRMAGDSYQLFVYLDYDRTAKDKPVLDVTTEPLKAPDPVVAKTGTFVVWRQIHVVRYIRKLGTIADWTPNFATAQGFYRAAYVEMVNAIGTQSYQLRHHTLANGSAPEYNARAEARLMATGTSLFTDHLVQDAAADHVADGAVFRLRLYADFVRELHTSLHSPAAVADFARVATQMGMTATEVATEVGTLVFAAAAPGTRNARMQETKDWLVAGGFETRAKWASQIRLYLTTPMQGLVEDLQTMSGGNGQGAAPDGLTVIHFDHLHSAVAEALAAGDGISMINGAAIDVADATRNRCVFAFTEPNTDTFVHEVGHHLFLPHARYSTTAAVPAGAQAARHDDDDANCTMSYNRPRPRFCGLCALRLRGWSATALSNDDASNTKP